MWNKKIMKLQEQILDLQRDIEEKDKEIEVLKSKLRGERHCSQICQRCKHAIPYTLWSGITGLYTDYLCELDNHCNDYLTVVEVKKND